MDSREAPPGAGNSGGLGGGYSFFAHFNPLSQQQRLAAHEVLPGLFLGSAVAARSASWLQQNGITHILCVHNSQASPEKLREELLEQNAQRRAILRAHPEREAERLQKEQTRLLELQKRQLIQHVAVYADRYVYCCCHATDDPSELVLPSLPLCIAFIEKALSDRTYRLHSPGQGASVEAAECAAQGLPPHNVRLLQSRRRNHVFVEKGRAVETFDLAEDALLDAGLPPAGREEGRDFEEKGDAPGAAGEAAATQIKSGGRVLVHCAKGISRSACVVLAFLLYRKSLRLQDALDFLRSKRPVYPNVGFQVQLEFLEERLEEVRPALPHQVRAAGERGKDFVKPPKTGASAALAFDSGVSIETSEPDIFLRDPTAKTRLRAFLAKAATELKATDLAERVQQDVPLHVLASSAAQNRVLAECAAVEERVGTLYSRTQLLQQRELWGPFGLFFENLRSYQLVQEEEVLRRAEQAAKKAAELKLVFAATLPGVSVADQVANEINLWISDCRRAASSRKTNSAERDETPLRPNSAAEASSTEDASKRPAVSSQRKDEAALHSPEERRRSFSTERTDSRPRRRAEESRRSSTSSPRSNSACREDGRRDKRERDADRPSPGRDKKSRRKEAKKKGKKEHKKKKLRLRFKQRSRDPSVDKKHRTSRSRSAGSSDSR